MIWNDWWEESATNLQSQRPGGLSFFFENAALSERAAERISLAAVNADSRTDGCHGRIGKSGIQGNCEEPPLAMKDGGTIKMDTMRKLTTTGVPNPRENNG